MMNTWIGRLLHKRLINKIADVYLGLPERDWSGELLPRKAEIAAADVMRIHELSEIADLSHWTYDTFLTVWRDPLYREEFPPLVTSERSAGKHKPTIDAA